MKYDKKYPDTSKGQEKDGMVYSSKIEPCCVCGSMTSWRDSRLIDYICSEECQNTVNHIRLAYSNKS